MVQPETMQEAVIAGFHILEGVTLPNGVVKTANGTFDYTQYTSMIDLPNKVYYFKTYENPQIIRVDLKPVWASRGTDGAGSGQHPCADPLRNDGVNKSPPLC